MAFWNDITVKIYADDFEEAESILLESMEAAAKVHPDKFKIEQYSDLDEFD